MSRPCRCPRSHAARAEAAGPGEAFAALSHAAQLRALRPVAAAALRAFGLPDASPRLLTYRGPAVFRAASADGAYILRIYGPGWPDDAALESEVAWLAALRRDTGLGVPEPMPAGDGAWIVRVPLVGEEPRRCVLMREVAGRFYDRGLTPIHLRRVGALMAALHTHADGFAPPAGFARPRWEAGPVFAPWLDPDRASPDVPAATRDALRAGSERLVAEVARLAPQPGAYGLIHADLQQTNYLFHGHEARAIDFDDCCWGYYLYDMAITLFELADRPNGAALRDAFLDGYARERPLPPDAGAGIRLFTGIRLVKRVNYLLRARDPALQAQRAQWLAYTARHLRAKLDGEIAD
jgi:Ser/Thr protein kinase RdoA (MazF antagonist)